MKKRFLALLTVLLVATLMTTAVFASTTLVLDSSVDTETALTEAQTFDVYIVISPFNKVGTSANANWVYRVAEDSANASKAPANANLNTKDEKFTLTWDKKSLEVAAVTYHTGGTSSSIKNDQDAGDGYKFAYLGKSLTNYVTPTPTGVGTGNLNTGTLVIDFGSDKVGAFIVREETSAPKAVVAKITFKVVAGAEGGEETITLDNTYTYVPTSKACANAQTSVTVTVEAGCEHKNMVAMNATQLANKGLTNNAATCMAPGNKWYHCSECNSDVNQTLNQLDHDFSVLKYVDGKEETCTAGASKAMYCSTDGCNEYDKNSVVPVDKLGHTFSESLYLAPTCTDDGYDLNYCIRCGAVANGEQQVAGTYYINGAFYANSAATTPLTKLPDAVTVVALGHEWKYDRTEGDVNYYVCTRKDACGVEDKAVSVSDTVRYVANSAKGTGDGSSAGNATTYAKAFEDLGKLPAGVDATIYLTEQIEIPQLQVSSNNKIVKSFEEPRHDANITVTTAPGKTKAALYFDFATVSQYYLYGPTVFDNIIISSNAKGGTSGTSESISIFARGFRFETTENLEMKSTLTGSDAVIPYSKNNGNFKYSKDLSYDFAACKIYLMGGFYSDGTNKGLYEGTTGTTFTSDLVLNGGEFYVVAGAGRNNSGLPVVNCELNITVGGNAVIGQLVPISIYDKQFSLSGTVANIHYYGGTIILAYRAEMQPRYDNQYTVNHFFYNGSGSMSIGDFMMGKKDPMHAKNVNCYYSVTDTASPSAREYGLGFIAKGDKLSGDVPLSDKYFETTENMSFPEYCVEHLGGHDVVGGKCSFCELTTCKTHKSEYYVESEATCITDGVSYYRCSVCFEHLSDTVRIPMSDDYHDAEFVVEKEPTCLTDGKSYYKCTICSEKLGDDIITPAGTDYHNAAWRLGDTVFEYYCSVCEKVLATRANNASTFYVSDNGKPDGGFTADYPVNDFEKAFEMAIASGKDATIYIVGSATVISNCTSSNTHYVFAEPEHDNHITIAGYNNVGILKICATDAGKQRTIYALNGDTTFENLEFTTWSYVAPEDASDYFTYIVAQHHHLTFGENVTTDFMRNTAANKISGAYYIMGGCYHYQYTKTTATKASECAGGDNHITFYSGAFFRFFGGSINGTCNNSNVNVDILGDVSFREYMVLGSNVNDAGDITLTLNGNLSVGKYFTLSGLNSKEDLSLGAVGDVTLKLINGSILHYNQEAKDHGITNPDNVPIGAAPYGDNGVFDVTRNLDSLTVIYDPTDATIKDLALSFGYFAEKTVNYKKLGSNEVCSKTVNGEHVRGEIVEEVESICSAQGHIIYNCTACGKNETVPLPEVPHSFGEGVTASAATCIKPEIEKKVCACGYVEFYIGDEAATGVHTFDEGNVCTGCLENKQALCAHENWSDPVEVKTGCGVGTKTVCLNCDKEVIEVTGADHNFGKYTVTVQPTATEPGVKVRSCRSCGKTETAVIYADGGAIGSTAIATDASGNLADIDVATSKLTSVEKEVLNALLQDTSYGSEVKVSYKVDGDKVTDITYSIPLPAEYANLRNVKVVVKDDDGTLHTVEFTVEKGFIVFKF